MSDIVKRVNEFLSEELRLLRECVHKDWKEIGWKNKDIKISKCTVCGEIRKNKQI